ncbi:MAG: peroxide stress protein YaaA [Bacteroidota bacterium]|nr:MAG: peroxide stress protein YaaA [Bacteroidota bacterium]
MITILSPAKNLNFKGEAQTKKYSLPEYSAKSAELIAELKKYSPGNLRELMDISDGLGELNFIRFQNWKPEHSPENCRQAILAFNGEVYNGLKASTLSQENLLFAQEHIRILSGLYGILRPLDLIQPYRLEMGTKLTVHTHKNLYSFWNGIISSALHTELGKHKEPYLVNLASNEYSKATLPEGFGKYLITPVFKESKSDEYKVITVYAKKARGLMTRFIIDNEINKPSELKDFDLEGYGFSAKLSTATEWVFTR